MISNSPDTYAYLTHELQKICGKVLVVLEGGYNLFALSVSSEAVMRVLSGDDKYYKEGEKYFEDLRERYKEMPKHNVGGGTFYTLNSYIYYMICRLIYIFIDILIGGLMCDFIWFEGHFADD